MLFKALAGLIKVKGQDKMGDITVRRANKNDILQIVNVHHKSAHTAYAGLFPKEVLSTIFNVKGLFADWNDYLGKAEENDIFMPMVAIEKGEIIGVLRSNIAHDDEAELLGGFGYDISADKSSMVHFKNIYISPNHQKKGVGLKLLQTVAQIAKDRGCVRGMTITLQGYDESMNFFKKTGNAEFVGRQAIDTSTMYKSIQGPAMHSNVWVIPDIDVVIAKNNVPAREYMKQRLLQEKVYS